MLKQLFKITADEYNNKHQKAFHSKYKINWDDKYAQLSTFADKDSVTITADYVKLTPEEVIGLTRWLVGWLAEYSDKQMENEVNKAISKIREKK